MREIRSVCNPQSKKKMSVEFGDFIFPKRLIKRPILVILLPRNEVCLGAELQSVSTCRFSLCCTIKHSKCIRLGVNTNGSDSCGAFADRKKNTPKQIRPSIAKIGFHTF